MEMIKENYVFKKTVRYEKPKVSVIIPVYKVEQYLTQCLNSVVNQTLEEIEIIIVDEGDQDRCREIIDFFEKNDPRIITSHVKRGGYGASVNYGMTIAKGEYIAIVESDDWIDSKMYEEMYQYAKIMDADVVKTPFTIYYTNGIQSDCPHRKLLRDKLPQGICFSMKEFCELLSVNTSIWAAIYKTGYLREKNIYFTEAKGGAYVDIGFRIDTLINSNKIAYLDSPFYNYRVDAVGSTSNNYNLSTMIQRWQEQHQKFMDIQEDYDKYYGKYLIIEEYICVFNYVNIIKLTKRQVDDISKCLSNYTEEMIINSPVLDDEQKREILSFRKNPQLFVKQKELLKNNQRIRKTFHEVSLLLINPVLLQIFFYCFLTSSLSSLLIHLSTHNSFPIIEKILFVLSMIFSLLILILLAYKLLRIIFKIVDKTINRGTK